MPRRSRLSILIACLVGVLEAVPGSTIAQCNLDESDTFTGIDTAANDNFARALAVRAGRAIFGAWLDDDAGASSGAAYVFELVGGSWLQSQKITASDAAADDRFGYSVSIDGDLAVVGAHLDDHMAQNAGSAYVFRFDGEDWIEEARLSASDAGANDQFGSAVAIRGQTIIIGAPLADDPDLGVDVGAAYLYEYEAGAWIERQILRPSDAAVGDNFGFAVAMDADQLAIGAATADIGMQADAGAVYIFQRGSKMWAEQQKLVAADAMFDNWFGDVLALDDDLLVIGVRRNDDQGANAGAAYIFRRSGTTWSQEQKIYALDADAGDGFATGVAIDAGLIVIGARADDEFGSNAGAAYLFEKAGSSWQQRAKLHASDAMSGDELGRAVGISGDQILAGAANANRTGVQSGAAYQFTDLMTDCNGDGTPDRCEIDQGLSTDLNGNGVPDVCECPGCEPIITRVRLVDQSGADLDPAEALTNPIRATPGITPRVRIDGWYLNARGSAPVTVRLRSADASVSVNSFTSIDSDGSSLVLNLPAFPPGDTPEDSITVDLTLQTVFGSTTVPCAFDYQIYTQQIAGGSGQSIQEAIDAAEPGTRIRLAPFSSFNDVALDFTGKSRITLTGDASKATSVALFGTMAAPGARFSGSGDHVVLSGVQIRDAVPGIIIRDGATPIISNCVIEGNIGVTAGELTAGGIDIDGGANPLISGCRINANEALFDGGGIAIKNSAATIIDCLITDNRSQRFGGGIFVSGATANTAVLLTGSTILCNRAELSGAGRGGGIYIGQGARVDLFQCEIRSNFATSAGGGVYATAPQSLAIGSCTISENQNAQLAPFTCAESWVNTEHTEGGGIYVASSTLPVIEDNLIEGNHASVGAGIYIADFSDPLITRNCILCNIATKAAADADDAFFAPGIYVEGSSFGDSAQPDLLNNLILNNRLIGTSSRPESGLAFGIFGGLLGQGAPQFANNLIALDPSLPCDAEPMVPQGWGIYIQNNRFASLRSNLVFGGLESTPAPGCDQSPATPGDTACTTCCPLVGTVDGLLTSNPLLAGLICVPVGSASPAYHSGLASAAALPPRRYRPDLPVSRGVIERDGVLPNPAQFPDPANFIRETGSGTSLRASTAPSVPVELIIETNPTPPPPGQLPPGARVMSMSASFTAVNASGVSVSFAQPVEIGLPLLRPVSSSQVVTLCQFNPAMSRFEDTGIVGSLVSTPRRQMIFSGVADLSQPVIALAIPAECGEAPELFLDLDGDMQVTSEDLCAWHADPVDFTGDGLAIAGDDAQLIVDLLGLDTSDCNVNGIPDQCDIQSGNSSDLDQDGQPDECDACPGDLNGDDLVNITDLNQVLGNFQQSGQPGIPGDANRDGVVNIADLNLVLGNFNLGCP